MRTARACVIGWQTMFLAPCDTHAAGTALRAAVCGWALYGWALRDIRRVYCVWRGYESYCKGRRKEWVDRSHGTAVLRRSLRTKEDMEELYADL
ncbi:hypothetical protein BKA63DRAFT_526769 [Paraphoma chrysanthemicola]|nr:hypothetical protein BKA63DRAFT_526769 [Paraphoma chrysanthemicola]